MFVDNPTWIEETFDKKLKDVDLGAVDRCQVVLEFVSELIHASRISRMSFIDWGGGYGLLTRMARDRGLNFKNFDPYVDSLFAGPANLPTLEPCQLILAGEVFLHLENPLQTLLELLKYAPIIVITAVVPPKNLQSDWWYLMKSTGQHIAFFPEKSLEKMALLAGVHLTSDSQFFHVFSKEKLNFSSRLVVNYRGIAFLRSYLRVGARNLMRALGRSKSLTEGDQTELIESRDEIERAE